MDEQYERNKRFQLAQFKRNVDFIYEQDSIHVLNKLRRELGIYNIACSRRREMIDAAKEIMIAKEEAQNKTRFNDDIIEWISSL